MVDIGSLIGGAAGGAVMQIIIKARNEYSKEFKKLELESKKLGTTFTRQQQLMLQGTTALKYGIHGLAIASAAWVAHSIKEYATLQSETTELSTAWSEMNVTAGKFFYTFLQGEKVISFLTGRMNEAAEGFETLSSVFVLLENDSERFWTIFKNTAVMSIKAVTDETLTMNDVLAASFTSVQGYAQQYKPTAVSQLKASQQKETKKVIDEENEARGSAVDALQKIRDKFDITGVSAQQLSEWMDQYWQRLLEGSLSLEDMQEGSREYALQLAINNTHLGKVNKEFSFLPSELRDLAIQSSRVTKSFYGLENDITRMTPREISDGMGQYTKRLLEGSVSMDGLTKGSKEYVIAQAINQAHLEKVNKEFNFLSLELKEFALGTNKATASVFQFGKELKGAGSIAHRTQFATERGRAAGVLDVSPYAKVRVTSPATKAQAGGVFTRPTMAMVGEAGPEAVVPLHRMGGNVTIGNITINANTGDPNQFAQEFVRATVKELKSAGFAMAG